MRTLALLLLIAGCFPAGSSSSDGGRTYGFGAPTLQVTINGLHFGPVAPDASAGAALSTTRDTTFGRVVDTTLTVNASAAATGASCVISARRFGDGVAPFAVGAYQLKGPTSGSTPDGTASPEGAELVTIPQGTWSCSTCDAVMLGITAIDANHLEGYLLGTLDNGQSGTNADASCSFYLPMRSYQP
jgi:hypothetical protein